MTLFPRHQGGSISREFAARCQAHRILDQARAGVDIPAGTIAWALVMTGDDDGATVDSAVEPCVLQVAA
jgi:hypothetical protein